MTRYTEDFKEMIIELNKEERSVRSLAKEYGITVATIYKANNCYGYGGWVR